MVIRFLLFMSVVTRALAVLTVLLIPIQASATTVWPAVSDIVLEQGQVALHEVHVKNSQDSIREYEVRLLLVEYVAEEDSLSFRVPDPEDAQMISYSPERFSLAPDEEVIIEVSISTEVSKAFGLEVIGRPLESVTIEVSDGAMSLIFVNNSKKAGIVEFSNFECEGTYIPVKRCRFTIHNKDFVVHQPRLLMVGTDVFGREIAAVDLNPVGKRVFPNEERVLEIERVSGFPLMLFGPVTYTVYQLGEDSAPVAVHSFRNFPVSGWLCLFLLLGGLIMVIRVRRKV